MPSASFYVQQELGSTLTILKYLLVTTLIRLNHFKLYGVTRYFISSKTMYYAKWFSETHRIA